MWHDCGRGDYPEDHHELLNVERCIRVVVVDDKMVYSTELRVYDPMLDSYVWNSQKNNIIAWMALPEYVRSK